jgi:hypothetical protein
MRDPSNMLEQEAVGVLGVNLIFAAFYQSQAKESFFDGLAQDVVRSRIEIDFVDVCGTAFVGWDRPTLLAYLVRAGLAEAGFLDSGSADSVARLVVRNSFQRADERAGRLPAHIVCAYRRGRLSDGLTVLAWRGAGGANSLAAAAAIGGSPLARQEQEAICISERWLWSAWSPA